MDSFLKPAARKTFSYIKDTTDFVKHIEDLDSIDFYKEEFYLVTMDVCSLCPNINHKEGALACRQALDKRKDKSVPSDYISDIILFILRSNTLKFKEKYFHHLNELHWAPLWPLILPTCSCLNLKQNY